MQVIHFPHKIFIFMDCVAVRKNNLPVNNFYDMSKKFQQSEYIVHTSEAKFPENTVPVPTPKFEVFWGICPRYSPKYWTVPTSKIPQFSPFKYLFPCPHNLGKIRESPLVPENPRKLHFPKKDPISSIFWQFFGN